MKIKDLNEIKYDPVEIFKKEKLVCKPPKKILSKEYIKFKTYIYLNFSHYINNSEIKIFSLDNIKISKFNNIFTNENFLIQNFTPFQFRNFEDFEDFNLTENERIKLTGRTLILPVSSSSTSHFLFEGHGFLNSKFINEIDNILITTSEIKGTVQLIKDTVGRDINIIFKPRGENIYTLENAIIPEYRFSLHSSQIKNLNIIKQKYLSNKNYFIYISRRDVKNKPRALLNEKEIEEMFKKFNFEVLYLQEMNQKDIFDKFVNAKFIAGSLGAGLYNAVFSNKNPKVLSLSSPNYIRWYLESCKAISKFEHIYCFGPDFLSYDKEQYGGLNDFVIDTNELKKYLEKSL